MELPWLLGSLQYSWDFLEARIGTTGFLGGPKPLQDVREGLAGGPCAPKAPEGPLADPLEQKKPKKIKKKPFDLFFMFV